MNHDIGRQLRAAAEHHHPDRAKIVALVEHRAAGPTVRHRAPSIARSGRRVALAALAAAGLLTTGGLAVAGIVSGPPPTPAVTTPAPPSPVESPTQSATATPSGPPPSATSSGPRPSPSLPVGRVQSGPLWTEGSVDGHSTVYWSQSNLVLGVGQPLTSLTVELRVAQTGGVQSTGTWRTLPADDFAVTVQQESGGSLVYRWVLKPGRTVPTGQHEFAAQFNHATGVRAAAGDSYRVDARTASGPATLRGGFAPAH